MVSNTPIQKLLASNKRKWERVCVERLDSYFHLKKDASTNYIQKFVFRVLLLVKYLQNKVQKDICSNAIKATQRVTVNSSELNSHALWWLFVKCFNSNTEALRKQQHSLNLFDLGALKLFCIFVYFISEGMLALLSIILTRPRFIKDLIFIVHCKLVCISKKNSATTFLKYFKLIANSTNCKLSWRRKSKSTIDVGALIFLLFWFSRKMKAQCKREKTPFLQIFNESPDFTGSV